MKHKKMFFAGAAAVMVGVTLSLRPYNPVRFRTVHEFAIQCNLRTDHFLEVFGGSLAGPDWCLHNTTLSLILYAMIGAGIFLIYRSRTRH